MDQDHIYTRLVDARSDRKALNELVTQYVPFIRSCVKKQAFKSQSAEDAMTLAMLAFVKSVEEYERGRGDFFAFSETVIRRSLIDDYRKDAKHASAHSFDVVDEDDREGNPYEYQASIRLHEENHQQLSLQEEIAELEESLATHGLSFEKLEKISPRQKRSRQLCTRMAHTVLDDTSMKEKYSRTGNIPGSELSSRLGISQKTIDKYRNYLIVLLLILGGDYPLIRAFLPEIEKGGNSHERSDSETGT